MKSDIYATARPSTTRVTVLHHASEPMSVAGSVNVDYVHSCIRSSEAGDPRPLFGLYRDILLSDSHLQGELNKRKLAVIGDRMRITPRDRKNPADKLAAQVVESQLNDNPGWINACSHALDSVLWPVSVLEKVYRISHTPGLIYDLAELVPVPHHLLDFREGRPRIHKVDPTTGTVLHEFEELDPVKYLVHRGHLLSFPDNFGGPFRSIVFWWLLSALGKDWWARFLDKYGSPFLVGKYPNEDHQGRTLLEKAFAWASRIGGIVVSAETQVEIKQAAASDSGEAFKTFLEVANREKSKLVNGQTLSADAQATGMGSGVADLQGGVKSDYKQFDALRWAFTVRTQLATQICQANQLTGAVPDIGWGGVSTAEQTALATVLSSLKTAGLEVDDTAIETLSDMVGFNLRRSAPSAAFPGPGAGALFSATEPDDLDLLASNAKRPVGRGLRARYDQLRDLLEKSTTPEAFTAAARSLLARTPGAIPGLQDALTTAAAAPFVDAKR